MGSTSDTTATKLHFVVVGGSLGGLATSIALTRLGHNVTILERNATPLLHNQGAGIVAGGDTLEFFRRYDRCGREIAVSSRQRVYFDRAGEVVHQVDMKQNMTSWDLAYHLMRANFDGVPSAYCTVPERQPTDGKATHLHDHTFTDVRLDPSSSKVIVSFTRGDNSTSTLTADYLIGADGPSSRVRSLFHPSIQRTYAGYCALRGTVPENSLPAATLSTFAEKFTFFHGPGVQILAYLIPGKNGSVVPGERLVNFVYYTNFPEGAELDEIMTDREGKRHRITMPPGMMSEKAWEKQKVRAREVLPPQFAEVVCATEMPFVQAVTDVICPEHEFLQGKVVLIGDALAGFRPHTVASTSQAAFDAMCFAEYMEGKIGREDWKRQTLGFARFIQRRGVEMGDRSQHRVLSLEEYIRDRDVASTPRKDEVYPEWAMAF